jgi:hypothetical protein
MRAKFIHQPSPNRLVAVYGEDAQQDHLEPIVAQLTQLPGVYAGVARGGSIDPAAPPVFLLWMSVEHGGDARTAVIRLKELTNPELSCTLGQLTISVVICQCKYVTTEYRGTFVNGLEPSNAKRFWLRFGLFMQRLQADEIIEDNVAHPYKKFGDAVEAILRGMKVYAAELHIHPRYSADPCTHPNSN